MVNFCQDIFNAIEYFMRKSEKLETEQIISTHAKLLLSIGIFLSIE